MTLPAGHPDTVRYARDLATVMATARDVMDDEQYEAVLPALATLQSLLPETSRPDTPSLRSA